jgi:hypothetical protein
MKIKIVLPGNYLHHNIVQIRIPKDWIKFKFDSIKLSVPFISDPSFGSQVQLNIPRTAATFRFRLRSFKTSHSDCIFKDVRTPFEAAHSAISTGWHWRFHGAKSNLSGAV